MKRWAVATTFALAIPVVGPVTVAATANADVCASAGRRVTVSGCANLSDVMAPYVVPPDAYAPVTPSAGVCVWAGTADGWTRTAAASSGNERPPRNPAGVFRSR